MSKLSIRNQIRSYKKQRNELIKMADHWIRTAKYLKKHPELTGTKKLGDIYRKVSQECSDLDADCGTDTIDSLHPINNDYGDGADMKDMIDMCNLDKYYPDEIDPDAIRDDLLYEYDISNRIEYGHTVDLMTASDFADFVYCPDRDDDNPVNSAKDRINDLDHRIKDHQDTVADKD